MAEDLAKIEDDIRTKMSDHDIRYVKIPSEHLQAVYNIFNQGIIDETNKCPEYLYYVALYYHKYMINLPLAKKYYKLAVEKNFVWAMNNLGVLYNKEKDYKMAQKYYIMAINNGSTLALNNLGALYKYLGKHELALKYFVKAIDAGENTAIKHVANLNNRKGDYNVAEKYYLKALDLGIMDGHELAAMYDKRNKYELAEKYYLLSISKGNKKSVYKLAMMYNNLEKYDLAINYYIMAAETNNQNAVNKINKILKNKYDVELAIRTKPYLDHNNKTKLEHILKYFRENRDNNFNGRLMDNMECSYCRDSSTQVLFLYCGHPLCTKCYKNKVVCTLCQTTVEINNNFSGYDTMTVGDIAREIIHDRITRAYDYLFMPIPDSELPAIYKLFYKNFVDENNQSEIYIFYLAIYYYMKNIESERIKAVACNDFLLQTGNVLAIVNLGINHERNKEYDDAIKYYLMAVEKNNNIAMYRLARIYLYKKEKKELAIKYFMMAANEYNIDARNKINEILEHDFNIELATQAESFLNKTNTETLNNFLMQYLENREHILN